MKLGDFEEDFGADFEEEDMEDMADLDFEEEAGDDAYDDDDYAYGSRGRWMLYVIPSAILVVLLVFVGVRFFRGRSAKEEEMPVFTEALEGEPIEGVPSEPLEEPEETLPEEPAEEGLEGALETGEGEDAEDPQQQMQSEQGAETDMSEVQTGVGENQNVSIGIDVE